MSAQSDALNALFDQGLLISDVFDAWAKRRDALDCELLAAAQEATEADQDVSVDDNAPTSYDAEGDRHGWVMGWIRSNWMDMWTPIELLPIHGGALCPSLTWSVWASVRLRK